MPFSFIIVVIFFFSLRKQDTCIIYSNERISLFMGGSGRVIFTGHPAEHSAAWPLYLFYISKWNMILKPVKIWLLPEDRA